MWHLDDELEVWFEEVEANRAEKYGLNKDRDVEVPLVQNELTRGRKRR